MDAIELPDPDTPLTSTTELREIHFNASNQNQKESPDDDDSLTIEGDIDINSDGETETGTDDDDGDEDDDEAYQGCGFIRNQSKSSFSRRNNSKDDEKERYNPDYNSSRMKNKSDPDLVLSQLDPNKIRKPIFESIDVLNKNKGVKSSQSILQTIIRPKNKNNSNSNNKDNKVKSSQQSNQSLNNQIYDRKSNLGGKNKKHPSTTTFGSESFDVFDHSASSFETLPDSQSLETVSNESVRSKKHYQQPREQGSNTFNREYFHGPPGDKGEHGATGQPGPSGEPGKRGKRGPSGEPGKNGERGPQGERGSLGERGHQGERGVPGPGGSIGPPGKPGKKGDPGERGPMGSMGPPGKKGDPGEKGERGPLGEKGPSGRDGEPGPQGPPGQRGPPGLPGVIGPRGESGVTGPTGRKGELGMTGERGQPGPTGELGPPGKDGPPGPTGEKGPIGPPGPLSRIDLCLYELIIFDLIGASSVSQRAVDNHTMMMMDPGCHRSIIAFCNNGEGLNQVSVDTEHMRATVKDVIPTVFYHNGRHLVTVMPTVKRSGEHKFELTFPIPEGIVGPGHLSLRFTLRNS